MLAYSFGFRTRPERKEKPFSTSDWNKVGLNMQFRSSQSPPNSRASKSNDLAPHDFGGPQLGDRPAILRIFTNKRKLAKGDSHFVPLSSMNAKSFSERSLEIPYNRFNSLTERRMPDDCRRSISRSTMVLSLLHRLHS